MFTVQVISCCSSLVQRPKDKMKEKRMSCLRSQIHIPRNLSLQCLCACVFSLSFLPSHLQPSSGSCSVFSLECLVLLLVTSLSSAPCIVFLLMHSIHFTSNKTSARELFVERETGTRVPSLFFVRFHFLESPLHVLSVA